MTGRDWQIGGTCQWSRRCFAKLCSSQRYIGPPPTHQKNELQTPDVILEQVSQLQNYCLALVPELTGWKRIFV